MDLGMDQLGNLRWRYQAVVMKTEERPSSTTASTMYQVSIFVHLWRRCGCCCLVVAVVVVAVGDAGTVTATLLAVLPHDVLSLSVATLLEALSWASLHKGSAPSCGSSMTAS